MSKSVNGNTYYVDFERIRKHGGYVYWWSLTDYLKPDKSGHLSNKQYYQGDCKLFRTKYLSFVLYKQPMGQDTDFSHSPENTKWRYPSPNSIHETTLKTVCDHVK